METKHVPEGETEVSLDDIEGVDEV
jgi:hypothetical protein